MSKLFFKGRIDPRQNHQNFGYNTKRVVKAGSANSPLSLIVKSLARKEELEIILDEKGLHADITIAPDQNENTTELNTVLDKPVPQTFARKINRNDPCSCGSGKKFKKCCGI
jgi:SWIM/SEC-C metal-binding protein